MEYSSVLSVEDQSRRLQYILSTSNSPRLSLLYLIRFLDFLSKRGNPVLYQSYYQELLPYFMELITQEALMFRSIDFLENLLTNADMFKKMCGENDNSVEFSNAVENLKIFLAQTYFYLGEWKSGFATLYPKGEMDRWIRLINDINKFPELSLLEQFELIVERTRKIDSQLTESLEKIYADWKDNIKFTNTDKVWILLIERDQFMTVSDRILVGTIKPFALKAEFRPQDIDEDFIQLNNRSLSYDDMIYYQALDAIQCVRDLSSLTSSRRKRYYKLTYSFPDKISTYIGESMGLGMGLLNLASVSRLNGSVFRYRLKQNLVTTGSLDILGNVRPIGQTSLKIKLETVFFSPFTTVLISHKNEDEAKAIIHSLSEKYPHRGLKIIGIDTLKNCIRNSNAIVKERIPLSQRVIPLRQKRYKTIISGIFFMIMFILSWYLITRDTNPVKMEIDGKYMRVFNLSGKELWQYDFGYELNADNYTAKVSSHKYLIEDLDGDGKNEIVIGTSEKEKNISGVIYYFESDGGLIWKFQDHPSISFGNEDMENFYVVRFVRYHDFNKNGQGELVVNFNHNLWYPNRAVIFDLKGEVLGEYWNSGTLEGIEFIDIDHDGVEEILFYGTNNDYNQAILGALEYGFITGHSPQDKSDYTPVGIPSGKERFYIRFPSASHIFPYAKGSRDVADRLIDLGENLFSCSIIAGEKSGSLLYKIDYQFNIHHFDFSDDFYVNYHRKFGKELYDDFPQNEIENYFKTLEFWDGDQWVTEPTENKYWRDGEKKNESRGELE